MFKFLQEALNVDSLFNNISLEETINRCFENEGLLKNRIQEYRNFYPLLQRNPTLYLMGSFTSLTMERLQVQLQVRHWLILFLYTLTRIGYKIAHLTLSLTTSSSMLMTPLLHSLHQNIQKPFEKFYKQSTYGHAISN